MSVMRPDLYPTMPDLHLAVPGDKVKHNFDLGTFKVLECNPNRGIMTVIHELDCMENPVEYGSIFLPHAITYAITEMRYAWDEGSE